MSIYLLSFDPYKTDAKALHSVISGNPGIPDWWHFIGSCYLLASNLTLSQLHQEIMTKWPNHHFLLLMVELKEGNNNGWLPKDAWTWIKKYY